MYAGPATFLICDGPFGNVSARTSGCVMLGAENITVKACNPLPPARGNGCGCSGCGGCWGCGTCWIWTPTWGWINTCWSESTPAGEETRVASEQITQTRVAAEKK